MSVGRETTPSFTGSSKDDKFAATDFQYSIQTLGFDDSTLNRRGLLMQP